MLLWNGRVHHGHGNVMANPPIHGDLYINEYYFGLTHRTWYDAKSDCSSRGGVLFYIENEDQQKFILKMVLNVHEYYPVWLGLVNQAQEETWKWVSGE